MGSRQKRGTLALGIDFGGSFIKMGLVDSRGRIHRRFSLEVRKNLSQSRLFEEICQAVESLREMTGRRGQTLLGVGMGLPGLIDTEKGFVHFLTNVPGWKNLPFAQKMRHRLRLPVFIDNDVNLMTLGEATFGAAKGFRHIICITLGTGVGGGLILNGALYRGASLSAGEIGHMPVSRKGPLCPCGSYGCLERYVGNEAIVAAARRRLRSGEASILPKLLDGNLRRMTPQTVHQAARRGDRLSRRVWEEVGEWVGIALAGLVNVLNPERIVIGGGVSSAGSFLLNPIRRTVRQRALDHPARQVNVVRAALGNDAGIIGASVLVRINMRERR